MKRGDTYFYKKRWYQNEKKDTHCMRPTVSGTGYKQTTISQIVKKAGVARGSFQNLFSTKDAILMELVGTMFSGQFGVAKNIVGDNMSPIYTYAVETAIQITLTELNENLREIYIEAYTMPETAEYI